VDAPEDPVARLDLVVEAFTRLIVDTEAQQRTMLRLSLEADPAERAALPLRQGRAIAWIGEALAPLQSELSDLQLHHLVLAIVQPTRDHRCNAPTANPQTTSGRIVPAMGSLSLGAVG
jgi:hypothetical protein